MFRSESGRTEEEEDSETSIHELSLLHDHCHRRNSQRLGISIVIIESELIQSIRYVTNIVAQKLNRTIEK